MIRSSTGVHFSSARLDWQTPKAVYQMLDAEFAFDFDPCPANPTFDGLEIEWGNSNFVNPPYGSEIPKWIAKGYAEAQKGKMVVFLIPSRTDTRWWHDYVMKADQIRFIKGRLKFDDQANSAPFPSAIVIFEEAALRRNKWPNIKLESTPPEFPRIQDHPVWKAGLTSETTPKRAGRGK